jgi:hypothetical protein
MPYMHSLLFVSPACFPRPQPSLCIQTANPQQTFQDDVRDDDLLSFELDGIALDAKDKNVYAPPLRR